MQNKKQLLKTGELAIFFRMRSALGFAMPLGLLLSAGGGYAPSAQAVSQGQVQFEAQVDQARVALDDTVVLHLNITSNSGVSVAAPEYNALDFDTVNESNSVSMQSYYDSSQGGFVTHHRQQITKVLRPKKTGEFKISDIRVVADGKILRARDLTIQVLSAGHGQGVSQPIRGKYGPGPSAGQPGFPARGALGGRGGMGGSQEQDRAVRPGTKPVFLRAEVDKTSSYKGEQIIVSYYLYHQVKIFNVQPDKYPVLKGFLREDIEIPVAGQRLLSEVASVNGVPYERTLLAKYAAFPLESRDLTIDSMSLKVSYYSNSGQNLFQEEDPFYGFFQQMTPRVISLQSELIKIDVKELPTVDRPPSFGGGVGQFNVVSVVNRYDVRANEPVTLTAKVEGRGNISAIKEPFIVWPEGLEMYESKGRTSSGRSGEGDKVFEYLLIPRVPGKVVLPALEFGFFDPIKKEYYTRTAAPITLNVLEPAPGTSLLPPKKQNGVQSASPLKSKEDLRYLKPPEIEQESDYLPAVWRILYWACSLAFFFFVLLVLRGLTRRFQNRASPRKTRVSTLSSKEWDKLRQLGQTGSHAASWNEVVGAYDTMSSLLLESLEKHYQVSARALSREEVERQLVEGKGFPRTEWDRIVRVLEFSDRVRFASSSGTFSETPARTELPTWVAEAEMIIKSLAPQRS